MAMDMIYTFLKRQALRYLPDGVLQTLKERHYARTLRAFDEGDEPDMRIVREVVARGSTAVDLGANVGVYTKLLSGLVGPTGRVISVEPVPQTFAILKSNIAALRMGNVTPVNAAVSDRESTVTMEIPSYDSGGGNFYRAEIVSGNGGQSADGQRRIQVRATTLDTLAGAETRISFIKCDVEGHEEACIHGAEETIRRHLPVWMVEVNDDPDVPDSSGARVFAFFTARTYSVWLFDGTRLRRRRPSERSTNYFFMTDAHIAGLKSAAPDILASS